MKVRNLKANHNITQQQAMMNKAVLASMKVRNLKANHNVGCPSTPQLRAVLASMKVRNLKANHNVDKFIINTCLCCISKYEGTESES